MKIKMKNIAILSGGDSSEYEISVKSATQIMKWINKEKYNPYLIHVKGTDWKVVTNSKASIPVDLRDFSIVINEEKVKFDYAYIIIHGDPGENGKIQAYLEMQHIPYNTCGVLTSALTFNKYACKLYLKNSGILTPESVLLKKNSELNPEYIRERVGMPCFVKPNNGGSSVGTSRVNKPEDLENAIALAFKEDTGIIVESYIKGTELSCGLVKTRSEEIIFPVTEIIPKNDFFDYEAKYKEGMSDEITPATVPEEIQKRCRQLSSEIYDILDCRGIVRIDYIVKGNQLYFLELNSIPGMSRESIVPKQIQTMGLNVEDIINLVIEDTIEN